MGQLQLFMVTNGNRKSEMWKTRGTGTYNMCIFCRLVIFSYPKSTGLVFHCVKVFSRCFLKGSQVLPAETKNI